MTGTVGAGGAGTTVGTDMGTATVGAPAAVSTTTGTTTTGTATTGTAVTGTGTAVTGTGTAVTGTDTAVTGTDTAVTGTGTAGTTTVTAVTGTDTAVTGTETAVTGTTTVTAVTGTTTVTAGHGVTAPAGFRAAGVTAGLKPSGNPDLALVVNDGPIRSAAGVFTGNRVKAAPVRWCEQIFSGTGDFTPALAAVVLNSGGANACTGPAGYADTIATAEHVAAALRVGSIQVAVCSTGLIGERLPMHKILKGSTVAVEALTTDGGPAAARAIMTTDTVAKQAEVSVGGFTVGGMAKGAGMLAPALATMLVVLTTDAVADNTMLDRALRAATRVSFDRLDSDGAMSTNDTVLLLASGASGVGPSQETLTAVVTKACKDLAGQLLADAEGATKEISIQVAHAVSEDDAVEVGRAVARNSLVKTAFFGEDANWGRILAAVGTTSATFDPDRIDVSINGVWVCRQGSNGDDRALVDLTGRQCSVVVDLHAGTETATIATNDLSHAYVHENSAYST